MGSEGRDASPAPGGGVGARWVLQAGAPLEAGAVLTVRCYDCLQCISCGRRTSRSRYVGGNRGRDQDKLESRRDSNFFRPGKIVTAEPQVARGVGVKGPAMVVPGLKVPTLPTLPTLLRLLLAVTALAPGSCFLLHRPPANQLRRLLTPMRMTADAAPPVYVIFGRPGKSKRRGRATRANVLS